MPAADRRGTGRGAGGATATAQERHNFKRTQLGALAAVGLEAVAEDGLELRTQRRDAAVPPSGQLTLASVLALHLVRARGEGGRREVRTRGAREAAGWRTGFVVESMHSSAVCYFFFCPTVAGTEGGAYGFDGV